MCEEILSLERRVGVHIYRRREAQSRENGRNSIDQMNPISPTGYVDSKEVCKKTRKERSTQGYGRS